MFKISVPIQFVDKKTKIEVVESFENGYNNSLLAKLLIPKKTIINTMNEAKKEEKTLSEQIEEFQIKTILEKQAEEKKKIANKLILENELYEKEKLEANYEYIKYKKEKDLNELKNKIDRLELENKLNEEIEKEKLEKLEKNLLDYEIKNKSKNMPKIIKYENKVNEKFEVCIGEDILGEDVFYNVLDGNLLIGGMTGGGKSNLLNVIITSLMLNHSKNEICFIGCDLAFADIYFFKKYKNFIGMSTTHEEFLGQLEWLECKIKDRAKILNEANCRNAISYNKKAKTKMSYIVFIVDELVALTNDKKCKTKLHERMSNSRKYGIYWILGGQDATKETIGRCKMNCTQTIGFKTFDTTDSDTLLGKNQCLNEITIDGRCKVKGKDGIKEAQIFYLEEEEIETRLKHLEK